MSRRSRLKCTHGKSKYDCPNCGVSRCPHRRRKRDCKHCHTNIEPLAIQWTLERQSSMQCKDTVRTIVPIGCQCPSERKVISSIVGCGHRYGCDHGTMVCIICCKTHRYRAWALSCCSTGSTTYRML